MTTDFARAHTAARWSPQRYRVPGAPRCAANDNRPQRRDAHPTEELLQSALRHFARHGLGAARTARSRADEAYLAGDRAAYDWWLGITRTLDRRLAFEAGLRSPCAAGSAIAAPFPCEDQR